jgi:hypothetical protein
MKAEPQWVGGGLAREAKGQKLSWQTPYSQTQISNKRLPLFATKNHIRDLVSTLKFIRKKP